MDGKIKGKFGFGCARFPQPEKPGVVDDAELTKMVDYFMDNGFNYFDTAKNYIDGESERALKRCLTSRYPRESFVLTDKLSHYYYRERSQIRGVLEGQLKDLGVDYLDFYFMHAMARSTYPHAMKAEAFDEVMKLKEEGKFKHLGMSFHDDADMLDRLLTDHPEIEVVQIQFNYLDYNDAAVQSRKVYETCQKHGKKVMAMEPAKGGSLARIPDDMKGFFDGLGDASYASYAYRFAMGFEDIIMVLSGASNFEQMKQNVDMAKNFKPLNEAEKAAIEKVVKAFGEKHVIPCTACRYCMPECPKKIAIADLFSTYNARRLFPKDFNQGIYYDAVYTAGSGKASDCIECGKCEKSCTQRLEIRKLLKEVAAEFEKPKTA